MRYLPKLIGWLCCTAHALAWTPIGNVTSNNISAQHADFYLNSGAIARVELLHSRVARVRVNPSGSLSARVSPAIVDQDWNLQNLTVGETNNAIWFVTESMRLAVFKNPFQVIAWYGDGSPMVADSEGAITWDETTGTIFASKAAPAEENFFGLGLNGGPINRKGHSIVMRNTDNSDYQEFTQPLYQSYPFYYGIREGKAYGIFLDNPAFPFFDMNTANQGRVLFGAEKGELDYYIIAGPDPADIAHVYGRLTGFNRLPPKWSLGYHHSRYGWKSDQEISKIADQLRSLNFPCDTLWFDIDYMDQLHHFTWNPKTFPDPIGMHDRLDQLGFHRVYISEPLLLQTDPLWPFLDGLGYFLKKPTGQSYVDSIWYGDVSFIDYTKTDTRAWYKEQLKTFLSTGISGLWLDLNEPANNFMPDAVYDFDGDTRTDLEARNLFALFHAKTAYEAQLELRPNVRPWNFSRSGYSGIQRYSHTWSGDPPSTFDSLKVAIQISVSMGLSGQNQFGHDTGGFLGSPNAELFTRWLEFSGFTPLFRNHSVNTADPREPWVFGEPYTSTIRDVIRRRYEFLPYIYTLMEEASRTGRPVVSPSLFYAPGDTNTFSQDTTYLFGPNLLVSPVFIEGQTNHTVYLPAGSDWVHFWSDRRFSGGQTVTVPSPVGRIPIFVRTGALLVRGGVMDYVGAPMDPSLRLDVYPVSESSFTLFEDDGISFAYEKSGYLRTELNCFWSDEQQQISLRRVAGEYQPLQRFWTIFVHNVTNAPGAISANGTLIDKLDPQEVPASTVNGWAFEPEEQLLSIRVRDQASPLTVEMVLPPTFMEEPADQVVRFGSSTTLAVRAKGTEPFAFQWFKNSIPLRGQTNSTLHLPDLQLADFGEYKVSVRNPAGEIISRSAVIKAPLTLRVTLNQSAKNPTISFSATAGISYILQFRDDLRDSPWRDLLKVPPVPIDSSVSFSDIAGSLSHERYYRIFAENLP